MAIEIREHAPGRDVGDFIRTAFEVFAGDPAFVPPLDFDIRGRLSPEKSPLFHHADVALFTARKDGRLVGRVSATVDRAWLETHRDETGHFGFLDTIDDVEVASALLGRAETWLKGKGMRRVNGPMSLSATEEIGMLVDGFQHPPSLSMGHSRSYQGRLVEAAGYTKEKDIYAWRYDAGIDINPRTQRAWESIMVLPEVKLRPVNVKKLRQELGVIMDIYNETWAGKWGWVPVTAAELDKMAEDLSLVLDPEIAFIAEVEGKPAGMCIMVPNLNEVIADMNGALFPFNWAKLLWRTKVARPKSTRLILLGVREAVRKNVKRYGGLSAAMYVEVARRGIARGYSWSELSWTRADDAPINLGIKSMGARIYKTYRVYEKMLGG
jgi:hypothetical protein